MNTKKIMDDFKKMLVKSGMKGHLRLYYIEEMEKILAANEERMCKCLHLEGSHAADGGLCLVKGCKCLKFEPLSPEHCYQEE